MNVEASFHDFSSASLFINEALSPNSSDLAWNRDPLLDFDNEKMGRRKPVGNNRVEEQQPSICKLLAIAF